MEQLTESVQPGESADAEKYDVLCGQLSCVFDLPEKFLRGVLYASKNGHLELAKKSPEGA